MLEQYEELGVCSIAAYARKNGYEVKMLSYKQDNINYKEILAYNPDIVGMPVYSVSKKAVYDVSQRLKESIVNTYICVGGSLPTYYGEEMLKESKDIDFAVRGESELIFLGIKFISSTISYKNIKGLVFRDGENIVFNEEGNPIENLDILPEPARDILLQNKLKVALISSSRGCRAKCSFCISQLFWKKWRGRNVKNVVDEIEHLVNNMKINSFTFIDSSFEDPDKECKRAMSIAHEIIKRDLAITYYADFRAEFHKIANDNILNTLKLSGLSGVCVGFEAGNDIDLRLYGKIANIEDNHKIIALFRKFDIHIVPGFINFNPYSTFETLYENIIFLENYGFACWINLVISKYRAFKGTRLYKKLRDDNLFKDKDEDQYYFRDKRVEELHEFLAEYIGKMVVNGENLFLKVQLYADEYLAFLSRLKKISNLLNDDISLEVILEIERNSYEVLMKVNSAVSNWFKVLLEAAKDSLNKEKAYIISNDILNIRFVYMVLEELENIKNTLYVKLARINPEYLSYIEKISYG